jgi:hypothetical protein
MFQLNLPEFIENETFQMTECRQTCRSHAWINLGLEASCMRIVNDVGSLGFQAQRSGRRGKYSFDLVLGLVMKETPV